MSSLIFFAEKNNDASLWSGVCSNSSLVFQWIHPRTLNISFRVLPLVVLNSCLAPLVAKSNPLICNIVVAKDAWWKSKAQAEILHKSLTGHPTIRMLNLEALFHFFTVRALKKGIIRQTHLHSQLFLNNISPNFPNLWSSFPSQKTPNDNPQKTDKLIIRVFDCISTQSTLCKCYMK